jgi:S-(hydroxymethyl)glutathione dehydrogenase/alcohol dehydrogenase
MDVRAAVAVAAGKPLEVTSVRLMGPREGEMRGARGRTDVPRR